MKVVCINNTKDGVKVSNLTQGKVYDSYSQSVAIVLVNHSQLLTPYPLVKEVMAMATIGRILIVNDKGVKEWYNNELFISLHEWRDLRLNEIGV